MTGAPREALRYGEVAFISCKAEKELLTCDRYCGGTGEAKSEAKKGFH
jgi:hypothetical protein